MAYTAVKWADVQAAINAVKTAQTAYNTAVSNSKTLKTGLDADQKKFNDAFTKLQSLQSDFDNQKYLATNTGYKNASTVLSAAEKKLNEARAYLDSGKYLEQNTAYQNALKAVTAAEANRDKAYNSMFDSDYAKAKAGEIAYGKAVTAVDKAYTTLDTARSNAEKLAQNAITTAEKTFNTSEVNLEKARVAAEKSAYTSIVSQQRIVDGNQLNLDKAQEKYQTSVDSFQGLIDRRNEEINNVSNYVNNIRDSLGGIRTNAEAKEVKTLLSQIQTAVNVTKIDDLIKTVTPSISQLNPSPKAPVTYNFDSALSSIKSSQNAIKQFYEVDRQKSIDAINQATTAYTEYTKKTVAENKTLIDEIGRSFSPKFDAISSKLQAANAATKVQLAAIPKTSLGYKNALANVESYSASLKNIDNILSDPIALKNYVEQNPTYKNAIARVNNYQDLIQKTKTVLGGDLSPDVRLFYENNLKQYEENIRTEQQKMSFAYTSSVDALNKSKTSFVASLKESQTKLQKEEESWLKINGSPQKAIYDSYLAEQKKIQEEYDNVTKEMEIDFWKRLGNPQLEMQQNLDSLISNLKNTETTLSNNLKSSTDNLSNLLRNIEISITNAKIPEEVESYKAMLGDLSTKAANLGLPDTTKFLDNADAALSQLITAKLNSFPVYANESNFKDFFKPNLWNTEINEMGYPIFNEEAFKNKLKTSSRSDLMGGGYLLNAIDNEMFGSGSWAGWKGGRSSSAFVMNGPALVGVQLSGGYYTPGHSLTFYYFTDNDGRKFGGFIKPYVGSTGGAYYLDDTNPWKDTPTQGLTPQDWINAANSVGVDYRPYFSPIETTGVRDSLVNQGYYPYQANLRHDEYGFGYWTTKYANYVGLYKAIEEKTKDMWLIGVPVGGQNHISMLYKSDGQGRLVPVINPATRQPFGNNYTGPRDLLPENDVGFFEGLVNLGVGFLKLPFDALQNEGFRRALIQVGSTALTLAGGFGGLGGAGSLGNAIFTSSVGQSLATTLGSDLAAKMVINSAIAAGTTAGMGGNSSDIFKSIAFASTGTWVSQNSTQVASTVGMDPERVKALSETINKAGGNITPEQLTVLIAQGVNTAIVAAIASPENVKDMIISNVLSNFADANVKNYAAQFLRGNISNSNVAFMSDAAGSVANVITSSLYNNTDIWTAMTNQLPSILASANQAKEVASKLPASGRADLSDKDKVVYDELKKSGLSDEVALAFSDSARSDLYGKQYGAALALNEVKALSPVYVTADRNFNLSEFTTEELQDLKRTGIATQAELDELQKRLNAPPSREFSSYIFDFAQRFIPGKSDTSRWSLIDFSEKSTPGGGSEIRWSLVDAPGSGTSSGGGLQIPIIKNLIGFSNGGNPAFKINDDPDSPTFTLFVVDGKFRAVDESGKIIYLAPTEAQNQKILSEYNKTSETIKKEINKQLPPEKQFKEIKEQVENQPVAIVKEKEEQQQQEQKTDAILEVIKKAAAKGISKEEEEVLEKAIQQATTSSSVLEEQKKLASLLEKLPDPETRFSPDRTIYDPEKLREVSSSLESRELWNSRYVQEFYKNMALQNLYDAAEQNKPMPYSFDDVDKVAYNSYLQDVAEYIKPAPSPGYIPGQVTPPGTTPGGTAPGGTAPGTPSPIPGGGTTGGTPPPAGPPGTRQPSEEQFQSASNLYEKASTRYENAKKAFDTYEKTQAYKDAQTMSPEKFEEKYYRLSNAVKTAEAERNTASDNYMRVVSQGILYGGYKPSPQQPPGTGEIGTELPTPPGGTTPGGVTPGGTTPGGTTPGGGGGEPVTGGGGVDIPAKKPSILQQAMLLSPISPKLMREPKLPSLANVFYYGKDFSSQRQVLSPEGELLQTLYQPLSVTTPGPELDVNEETVENPLNMQFQGNLLPSLLTNSEA